MVAVTNERGTLTGQLIVPLSTEARDRLWQRLETAFDAVLRGDGVNTFSYEQLYRSGYDLVHRQCGDFLYRETRRWFERVCRQIAQDLASIPITALPVAFAERYRSFEAASMIIGDLLMYMEKNYCARLGEPSVHRMAAIQFRVRVFQESPIGQRLTDLIVGAMKTLREAEDYQEVARTGNMQTLRDVVVSVLATDQPERRFDAYRQYVTEPLSRATEEFFTGDVKWAQRNLKGAQLLNYVYRRTTEERGILHALGIREPSTLQHHDALVTIHWRNKLVGTLLDNDEVSILEIFRRQDIEAGRKLWSILRISEEGKSAFVLKYREALETMLLELLQGAQNVAARVCVERLSELRERHLSFVARATERECSLEVQMTKAMCHVSEASKLFAQKLCSAVNEVLVDLHTGKTATSSQEEAVSVIREYCRTAIMVPFQALQNHDTFEFHYRLQLINRLLDVIARRYVEDDVDGWVSGPIELEREAIKPFQEECGDNYVAKLKGFLDDIVLSRDCVSGFEDSLALETAMTDAPLNTTHLRPLVIAATQWMRERAETPTVNFTHIPSMQIAAHGFEAYYRTVHQHRKLKWLSESGKGLLRFHYGRLPNNNQTGHHVDLICTTMQLMILLLFNHYDSLSWSNIQQLLDLKPNNLQYAIRQAMGLYLRPTIQILALQTPNQQVLHDNDVLTINNSFQSERRRLVCPVLTLKALKARREGHIDASRSVGLIDPVGPEEDPSSESLTGIRINDATGVPHAVELARQSIIEAAIVRLMKQQRKMSHSMLVAAVNEAVGRWNFLPTPGVVKERIEVLINREYLMRDPDDPRNYQYIT